MPDIEFQAGPLAGHRLTLSGESYSLGRRPDMDLQLDDGLTSGAHAELRSDNGAWEIVDLGSSNGTLLNGARVTTARLSDGDLVQIGGSRFIFEAESSVEMAEVEEAVESAEPEETFETTEVAETEIVEEPVAEPIAAAPRTAAAVASADELALVEKMRVHTERIRNEVGKIIVGQRDVLDQILMCILANGHALLIGLPGMAKTLTVRTIAQVLNLKFKRVQFTPDLMPGDIIGTDVLETNSATGEKEFRFIKGPIFCNLLLADEINRTPPKTQAALLEAMQEKMVTAGNTSYTLEEPFFVLATQNPIEQEGTYPLPEAQLDRFMFNIWVDYPLPHEEEEILRATTGGKRIDPQPVLTQADVLHLQAVVRKVPVSDHVIKYVTKLVGATRPQSEGAPQVTKTYVSTGAGPRAGQYLILAAKAMAILEGRIHVSCADIRRAAPPVLRHRILTNFAADSEGLTPLAVVKKLLEEVPEPDAEAYAAKR